MTNHHAAPPLPRPQPAGEAARALSRAAQAAASAWNNSMEPMQHNRAVRQLRSALRSTGLAIWGLAYYQTTDNTEPQPAVTGFLYELLSASRSMLKACECLEDALSAERPSLPDESEPGTILCRTAWKTIRAWRRPTGTTADRDQVIEQLTAATEALEQAAHNLSFQAPLPCGKHLGAACSYLSEATLSLTKARRPPTASTPAPAAKTSLPHSTQGRPQAGGGAP